LTAKTIIKILGGLPMEYNDIKNKYATAGIECFNFNNIQQMQKVLGYDFRKVTGFNKLSDEDKLLSEKLFCRFINNNGIEMREKIKPVKITRGNGYFIVTFKDEEYSYLYDDGSIG
jgi:hypothetical protein